MHKYIVKAEVETDTLISECFTLKNVNYDNYCLLLNVSGYTKYDANKIARSFCELFAKDNNPNLVNITEVKANTIKHDHFDYYVGRNSYKCYVNFQSIEKN